MREGDRSRCRNCGDPIRVELFWSGLKWVHVYLRPNCHGAARVSDTGEKP